MVLPGFTSMRYGLASTRLPETRQQRGRALPEVRGAEQEDQQRDDDGARDNRRVAAKRLCFEPAALFDGGAPLDGLLDQTPRERGRVRWRVLFGFERAQDGGFERRLALFEIERDLLVADAAPLRQHEEVAAPARRRS